MREGWEIKKLEDIFDVQSSKRVHKSDWKTEGVPFYRAREVVKLAKNGFVENELFISEKLFKEFTKDKGAPQKDDIIISAVGTLGECYVVNENDRFYIKDASVLWLSKISNIYSRYIEYAFKSKVVQDQVMDKSMGATVGTLTIGRAKNIQIPIPRLSEQIRIVSLLDQTFEAIDKAKANAVKNLNNAKELFESYLQGVFSNGHGWEIKELTEIVQERCSLSYGIVQPGDDYPNGLPVIRPVDMKQKFISKKGLKLINPDRAKSYQRTILVGDELLICVRGETGVVSLIPNELKGANVTRGIVPIAFDTDQIILSFGYYLFLSPFIQKQIKDKTYGAALMQINIRDLRKLKMPIPNLNTQNKIVNSSDKISSETQKLQSIYQKKLDDLEELKKSILQKAFKGEL